MVIICQSKLWLDFPWGKCGSLVGLLFSVFEVILGITADAKYLISTVFFSFLNICSYCCWEQDTTWTWNVSDEYCAFHWHYFLFFLSFVWWPRVEKCSYSWTLCPICIMWLSRLTRGSIVIYYSCTSRPGGIHRRMSIFADVELVPVCALVYYKCCSRNTVVHGNQG